MTQRKVVRKVRRRRRHLRPSIAIALVAIFIIAFLAYYMPRKRESTKLMNLGYTKEDVEIIREKKLSSTLINNQYYSPYLAESIRNDTLNEDYLLLYTVVPSDRGLSEKDFLLYARLVDMGYEEDQLLNLFGNLYFHEMTPLLVFKYQFDERPYVDDCLEHRDSNSENEFYLSSDYSVNYKKKTEETKIGDDMLINRQYYLKENSEPVDLVTLGDRYAVVNQSVRKEAAKSLENWIEDSIQNNTSFFVALGYRSYHDQEEVYKSYLRTTTEDEADMVCARAGHSEHQSGLAVNLSQTSQGDIAFSESEAGKYALKTCVENGWIQRYPIGKEIIHGMDPEDNHFRYLGNELAKKVSDSKLTYDEYYSLYLKDWYDESNKPSEKILEHLGMS